MPKQTTVRLPDDLAEKVETVARAKGTSVNQFIIDSLEIEIDRVRKDTKFMNRVKQLVERDREIHDELAQ
jgi:predicted transcriptional regulator